MTTTRRRFLGMAAAAAAVPLLGPRTLDAMEGRLEPFVGLSPQGAATEEAFWDQIRRVFPVPTAYVHLENGYSSPQPTPTFEAFTRYTQDINNNLSWFMRRRMLGEVASVKRELADLAGVPEDELVITRNTTESLDTVIAGFDWKAGDEAVMAEQDYGAMLDMFKLQARRYGIVNRVVSLPNDPRTDDELVQLYANAITPRTRLLMVSHLVNITGQVLPVQKIAAIYCRVSTADQSCERQERDLRAYAVKAGWQVAGVWKETASGTKDSRKERQEIMSLAQARKLDIILVTELTRWGRSTIDLIHTLQDLHSWGVSLIAQSGLQYDLATPQGKLMANIMASLAEFEGDVIRERVKSGIAAAKARGQKIGRQPGQRIKSDHLAPKVLDMIEEGGSYRAIADKLNISKSTVTEIVKRHRSTTVQIVEIEKGPTDTSQHHKGSIPTT